MAQADSVRSSSRQLITGESANQSTSLRAIKLPRSRFNPLIATTLSAIPTPASSRTATRLSCSGSGGKDVPMLSWDLSNCRCYAASTGQEPPGPEYRGSVLRDRRIFAGATAFLSCFGSGVGISAYASAQLDGMMSSNRLVRSKPQGRLR